jgi:acylphosphatase
VVAEGPRQAAERLLADLRCGAGPGQITHASERWSQPVGGLSGFRER